MSHSFLSLPHCSLLTHLSEVCNVFQFPPVCVCVCVCQSLPGSQGEEGSSTSTTHTELTVHRLLLQALEQYMSLCVLVKNVKYAKNKYVFILTS